jgi:hypothetical protein
MDNGYFIYYIFAIIVITFYAYQFSRNTKETAVVVPEASEWISECGKHRPIEACFEDYTLLYMKFHNKEND